MRQRRNTSVEQEESLANHIMLARQRCATAVNAWAVGKRAYAAHNGQGLASEDERLKAGISAIEAYAAPRSKLRASAHHASGCWREVEAAVWALAWSGRHIAIAESRKLYDGFLDEQDFEQEGFIGLLKAAQRFDLNKGVRFSTYARWWVRSQMNRSILLVSRAVRMSGCAADQLRDIRRATASFLEMGLPYTTADIAEELGISQRRVDLLLSQKPTVSLDTPLRDSEGERTIGTKIADPRAVRPDEAVAQIDEIEKLTQAMKRVLPERQSDILSKRYGLATGLPMTLNEVGAAMNLSRERVRQLEQAALKRLRVPGRIRDPVEA
jgi:RNA polymerase sigma factor (sigma-70 family)